MEIGMKIFQWIYDRMKEPSSYAACAVGGVGIGVLLDQPIVIMVAVGAAAIAFVLREKGIL
jgi:hypothetical protein|tara:strand:- start:255 stop:437 length:183 start_codon:yes stop_codon:yes gene_type:complete